MLRRFRILEGSESAWALCVEFGPYLATLCASPAPRDLLLPMLYRHYLEGFAPAPEPSRVPQSPTAAPAEPLTVISAPARRRQGLADPVRDFHEEGREVGTDAVAEVGRLITLRLLEDFGPGHGLTNRTEFRRLLGRLSDAEVQAWGRTEFERCFGPLPELGFDLPAEVVVWLKRSLGIAVATPCEKP